MVELRLNAEWKRVWTPMGAGFKHRDGRFVMVSVNADGALHVSISRKGQPPTDAWIHRTLADFLPDGAEEQFGIQGRARHFRGAPPSYATSPLPRFT